MKKKLATTSLKPRRSPHTVLLRMAADIERAERIRSIKAARPDLTWPQVAEAVGVTERSVASWAQTGQVSYPNAKKLAAFLKVDLDWLWKGPRESPDLIAALSTSATQSRLDRIEGKLDLILASMLEQELEDDDQQEHPRARGSASASGE